ncbi:hypothetical protein [Rossellomorea marisflavi]|uniref:hypothetical protein n=1 Tax=Rossellomorea marisflavi TaxID=189381 RepID=UPI003F9FF432
MTQEEVIRLGQKALEVDGSVWVKVGLVGMVIGVIIFIIAIGTVSPTGGGLAMIFGILGFFAFIGGSFSDSNIKDNQVAKWNKEVATPYIESLPVEKRNVVYIKIDPELTSETEGSFYYTTSKTVERTPLTFSFKENGLTTLTNWYETHMELTDEEKPYVTYQYVPKKLGEGVEKGFYNVKLYLPENYEFTDIK